MFKCRKNPQANAWLTHDADENQILLMKIIEDNVILCADEVVLETIRLIPAMKIIAFHKKDVLSMNVNQNNVKRRFRIQFSCSELEILTCIQFLQKFIRIQVAEEPEAKGFATLDEKIKDLLTKNPTEALPASESLPRNYPLEAAMKLCLLDPGFPKIMEDVAQSMEDILQGSCSKE